MKKWQLTLLVLIVLSTSYQVVLADNGSFSSDMIVANRLLNESKPYQAVEVYKAILLKDPEYYPAKLALGTVFMRQAKYVDAEKLFLGVINSGTNSANAYERLALNYINWATSTPDSDEYLMNKANDAIKKAMQINKSSDKVYATLALINITQKNYEDALINLNTAHHINPGNQDVYTNYGILYTRVKKYDLALEYFQRAINVDISAPRPYRELGNMLEESGQIRQAIEYIKKARFHDIFDTYEDRIRIARLDEKVGDIQAAIDEYNAALRLKPHSADCHTQIARLYGVLGNEGRSIKSYKTAVKENYGVLENMISQAQHNLRNGDYLKARNMFRQILDVESGNRYAFEGLCSLNYAQSSDGLLNPDDLYADKVLLRSNMGNYKGNTNIRDMSWAKILLISQGSGQEGKSIIEKIAGISANTPDDIVAKGEALFFLNQYTQANDVLRTLAAQYSLNQDDAKQIKSASEQMLWFADKLFFNRELIASRSIYDRINNIKKSDLAVTGLSAIAIRRERSEVIADSIKNIKKAPGYHSEAITKLQEAVNLFPQNSKAHYLLSEQYTSIQQYSEALEEYRLFEDSVTLTPFDQIPNVGEIKRLLDNYNKMRNINIMNKFNRYNTTDRLKQ